MNQTGKTKSMIVTTMFMALTVVMMFTPLGTLRLPVVSVTIAHIPTIVAALVLGLKQGIMVSLSFALTSMFIAIISPTSVLDPFFANPLISVLPRVLIPVTTYYVSRLFKKDSKVGIMVSTLLGNLTNTFGVYTMLYLIYAQAILEQSGNSAVSLIIGAISTSTLIKSVIVVLIVTPTVMALRRVIKK